MTGIVQDLRYAIRGLAKSPGFSTVAVLTLALGIGANTAMFAVINGVLLKPLPFSDPEQLMLVHLLLPDREAAQMGGLREMVWSYPKYRTFLELQRAFENTALFAGRDLSLSGDDNPEQVRGEVVTDRYPGILGVLPMLGRAFTGEEAHRAGAQPVAMIGHSLWMRRYGGDAGILGRTIQINAAPYTVVGVLPPGFRGLSGNADVWVPFAVFEPRFLQERSAHGYYLVARRKPEFSESAAIAAVRVVGTQIDAEYRKGAREGASWGATAASLYDSRVDADLRRATLVLLGSVGFVLLIACLNLTNLLIAKAISRRREVAVRVAIGASRLRIARQFLTESVVLAGLGATAGLMFAVALLRSAAALLPQSDVFFRSPIAPGVPRVAGADGLARIGASMIEFDVITLLFVCGVTVITGALIALVPAMQASSLRPVDAMKTGGSAGTARGLHAFGVRATLVTAQIALALVLLTGAGLMVKSAARLQGTGIGVNPDGVLTVRLDLPGASYNNEKGTAFFAQVVERVRAVPGVESVGLGNCPPVSGGCAGTVIGFERGRHRFRPPDAPVTGIHWVTPEYFSTLGIQLRRGRPFTDQDRQGRPKTVLVNEAAARAFWPNTDPIGKSVTLGQGGFEDGAEVIGIVSDVRYRTIEAAATPDVYVPAAQSYNSRMRLFVRSNLDTESLATAVRREVRTLDPNLPLSEVKTMEERVGDAMWRTRVAAWLFSAFAALALLLTAIGIFGVMAQTVTQRTPEIGVRMALGAQRQEVLRLVLGRAAVLSVLGIIIGVGFALGLTRVLTALLYEVQPNDPSTFVVVSAVLGVVSLAACYLPAHRAARVDPLVALRYE